MDRFEELVQLVMKELSEHLIDAKEDNMELKAALEKLARVIKEVEGNGKPGLRAQVQMLIQAKEREEKSKAVRNGIITIIVGSLVAGAVSFAIAVST